ncbi:MAG: VCBS repeat-containing protein [Lentisphaeraceae bacterium]|nr:VCBS repeat-containing protein [Lentisphaeraceae bacterium]
MKSLVLFFTFSTFSLFAIEWQPIEVHKGSRSNTAIAIDFDKDGKCEIVYHCAKKLHLVSHDGTQKRVIAENVHYIHSAAGDIDGDGDIDYVGGLKGVAWLECPKDIWKDEWKLHLISDELNGTHAVETIDMDNDGKVDVVANSFNPTGKYPSSICWFKNLGDGKWETYPIADKDAIGGSHYFKIFDLNGKRALCAGAKGGAFANGNYYALYQAGDSLTKPWKKSLLLTDQEGATNIYPADYNGDGSIDYAVANGHGVGIKMISGKDKKVSLIDPDMECPHCLDAGDLDNDGDLDLITCGYQSSELAWYENLGSLKFKKHSIQTNQKSYDIRLVDIDGDGLKDILVAGQGSNNVIWFKQKK